MATSSTAKGWQQQEGRLAAVYNGTEVFDFDANDMVITPATTVTGALVGSSTVTSTGVFTASAEARIANGFNLRVGTITAFGTTQPTNAVVMRSGTAPAGTITTAGGIFASDTVVRKIIADGTVSDVQT